MFEGDEQDERVMALMATPVDLGQVRHLKITWLVNKLFIDEITIDVSLQPSFFGRKQHALLGCFFSQQGATLLVRALCPAFYISSDTNSFCLDNFFYLQILAASLLLHHAGCILHLLKN